MISSRIVSQVATLVGISLSSSLAIAQAPNANFSNVSWTRDNSNSFEYDQSGDCGRITNGATKFTLWGPDRDCYYNDDTNRQELKFERREGITALVGTFSFNYPSFTDDGGVSVAQTHDNETGSDGVFTIYRIHYEANDGNYYFGVQGDLCGYSCYPNTQIEPSQNYYIDIQTYTDADAPGNTFERTRLFKDNKNGQLIWEYTMDEGANEGQQYKKIGAYELSNTEAGLNVFWNNVRHYTGTVN